MVAPPPATHRSRSRYSIARAVLSNPLTFDIDGATHAADASKMFRLEAPVMNAIPAGKPLFVVRSGKDEMPGLNASLDRFVMHLLATNHPIRLVNHPDAPHSFDLFHDREGTRRILRAALAFLRDELQSVGGTLCTSCTLAPMVTPLRTRVEVAAIHPGTARGWA